MAGAGRTGNFAQAGKAAARENERILQGTLENSPNMSKIVQEAAVRRGKENIAAMAAETKVAKAGVEEYGKTKTLKTKMDAEEGYRKEKRKAGVLASAGQLLGTGIGGLGKSDRKPRELGAYDSFFDKQEGRARAALSDADKALQDHINGSKTKPTSPSASTDTSAGTGTGKGSVSTTGGGDLSMQYMQKLTGAGMSDQQAAATVGHLIVETGGFKHMEELAPNRHGTKGYGHLQWTDPTPGRGRRTDFMNWTANNNLDPQTFDANSGFLVHEMTTNFNGSWTGGGSFEGLKQTGSLEEASGYLQKNFIRPGEPHTDRRLAEGNNVLQQWRAYSGS